MNKLIITNGDAAAGRLRHLFPGDDILPWHDVLHDGPVPGAIDFFDLTQIRETYLARTFESVDERPPSKLKARDLVLKEQANFDRIELWFEHDLYDQLQLLQVLDYFKTVGRRAGVFICQSDDYLGYVNDQQLAAVGQGASPVLPDALGFAQLAWAAFRQPNPKAWCQLVNSSDSTLPHFTSAATRMLEELPDSVNGLTRSEHQILAQLQNSTSKPGHLFGSCQQTEEAVFMGDWPFFLLLENLTTCPVPLVSGLGALSFQKLDTDQDRQTYLAKDLRLTDVAVRALSGRFDHVAENGIDRWWGGTHLTSGNDWRWNTSTNSVIQKMR